MVRIMQEPIEPDWTVRVRRAASRAGKGQEMTIRRPSVGTGARSGTARVVGSTLATFALALAVAFTGSHGAIAASFYCLALVAASLVAAADSRSPGDWRRTEGSTDAT